MVIFIAEKVRYSGITNRTKYMENNYRNTRLIYMIFTKKHKIVLKKQAKVRAENVQGGTIFLHA